MLGIIVSVLILIGTVVFWKIVGLLGVVFAAAIMGIFDKRFAVLAVFAFMAYIWCGLFLVI